MSSTIRPGLGVLPWRIRHLPVHRGFPVPWFVENDENGMPDFRYTSMEKWHTAMHDRRCWICGQPLNDRFCFILGALSMVTRATAEGPMHSDCAAWAAMHCPFLNGQQTRRGSANDPNLAERGRAPGIANLDPPSLVVLWKTARRAMVLQARLVKVGRADSIACFLGGRPAERPEILAAVEAVYPRLLELCDSPAAVEDLQIDYAAALALVDRCYPPPAADPIL